LKQVIVIGGGAAGFFFAINYKEFHPQEEVIILERAQKPLQKLKMSGGGRCNVTHACFEVKELVKHYPRGQKALQSVFARFQPGDTFDWFEKRGVALETLDDNCVFPLSNDSQTIIDCFLREAQKLNIQIRYQTSVTDFTTIGDTFEVHTDQGVFNAHKVMVATGSSPAIWKILAKMGHSIVSPVPSLFTFVCHENGINALSGIVQEEATVSIPALKQEGFGPLLITHHGFSGPAVLRLSAWAARELALSQYQFTLQINWISKPFAQVFEELKSLKQNHPKKQISNAISFNLPRRLWDLLVQLAHISPQHNMADINHKSLEKLAQLITSYTTQVVGKNTHKEEFVTAGGVDLDEINFKTMESKLFPNLHFAGEVLNIDGLTGGFNFQNAWSTAFVAAKR